MKMTARTWRVFFGLIVKRFTKWILISLGMLYLSVLIVKPSETTTRWSFWAIVVFWAIISIWLGWDDTHPKDPCLYAESPFWTCGDECVTETGGTCNLPQHYRERLADLGYQPA